MADETHGIGVTIDSTGARAGEADVVRSLERIKAKTKETGDAGQDAGKRMGDGLGKASAGAHKAARSLDEIRAKARQAGTDAASAASKAGSAWERAFARIKAAGATGLNKAFQSLRYDMASLNRETGSTSNGFLRARVSADGLYTSLVALRNAAVVLIGIQLGRKFLDITDTAKKMEAQLKLTIPATMSMGQAQQQVAEIARRTRAGLEDTTNLYGKIARQAAEMGKSADSAGRATETVAKALKISGAGASETSSTIRQLTQALASGVLRGDEFNSMMENSPRLAKLLADSIGVPVGSLREMAEQGKLTADIVYRALTDTKFTDKLDEEFKQIPATFEDAMTAVHNSALTVFSQFDQGGQFSTMLVDFITGGTSGFEELGKNAEEFGIQTRATIEGLASVWDGFRDVGIEAFNALKEAAKAFGFDFEAAFSGDFVRNTMREVQGIGNAIIDAANAARRVTGRDPIPRINVVERYDQGRDAAMSSLRAGQQERQWQRFLPRGLNFQGPTDLRNYMKTGSAISTSPSRPASSNTGGGLTANAEVGRTWTGKEVAALLRSGGFRVTDVDRTRGQQQAQIDKWLKEDPATRGIRPAGLNGPHVRGVGVDIGREHSIASIKSFLKSKGVPIAQLLNEGDHKHLEIGRRGGKSDQEKALEREIRLADRRKEQEDEYWAKLANTAKVAGMLPHEAEKYNRQLELQLIRADGQLDKVKDLSAEEKNRINQAVDLANKQKLIADLQGASKNAQIEQTKLLDEQQALSAGTREEVEAQLHLEERLWPYKQRALEMGLDLQDETVKKALAEVAAREKVNYEIARRNRLILEGNDLVDDMLNELDPTRRVRTDYRKNLERIGASTRPQDQKDAALEQLNKNYAREMNDIQREFYENMLDNVHDIGDAFGGSFGEIIDGLGSLAVMVQQMAQATYQAGTVGAHADNPVSKVATGLQGLSTSLGTLFGPNSKMGKNFAGISKGLGAISDGAATGQQVAGIAKALGFRKFSTTGAEIGGGIGGGIGMAIGGPAGAQIGAFLGSALGGTIGALFKKTKQGGATITGGFGDATTFGNSGKAMEAASAAARSVQQGLQNIANALGGTIGGFNLTIGQRHGDWRVNTGGSSLKIAGGAKDFNDDQQAAIAYAILQAIKQGALKGLSAATERILRAGTENNIDQLVQAAQVYEQLVKASAASANPMAAAFNQFITSMQNTMQMLKGAGYTYEELAALSGAFAEQQRQVLEEMTAGYQAFLKEITQGPSSGKTIFDQFMAAQSSFQQLLAGGRYTQDQFTEAGQTYLDLARQVYGSATPQFEAVRQSLVDATQHAIDQATQAAQDALNSAGIIAAIGEGNSILTAILNHMYGRTTAPTSGGGSTTTPTSPYSVGSVAPVTTSGGDVSYSYGGGGSMLLGDRFSVREL